MVQRLSLIATTTVLSLAGPAPAQELLIPDTSGDRIMLFSALDGSLIDPDFIDLSVIPLPGTRFPYETRMVDPPFPGPGLEIWISDQIVDVLYRFSEDGSTFLGSVGQSLDDIRGIEFVDGPGVGHLFVSNSGAGGGAPGDAIVEIDSMGTTLGAFPEGDPYDVVEFQSLLLISNGASDDLDLFTTTGVFVGTFHDSDGQTGIDAPRQISINDDGNVLAGGVESPSGIYEYDVLGNQVNYHSVGPVRGVFQLGDGNILFTNDSGVRIFNVSTMAITPVITGLSATYIGGYDLPGCPLPTSYCIAAPNSVGSGALIGNLGTTSIAANDFVLQVTGAPPIQFGLFYYGPDQIQVPFGDGFRCVAVGALGLFRLNPPLSISAAGTASHLVDLTAPPEPAGQITAGSEWNFQFWYRDPVAGGAAFNLSDGWNAIFLPLMWAPPPTGPPAG